jgi:TonB family protein
VAASREGYNQFFAPAAYLMKPASVLLESTPEPLPEAASSPAFLVDLPAWHTVFFRNLLDLFCSVQQAPFKPSSPPGSFWPDVFVTSRPPWSRFALSVFGHVAACAALLGSIQLWPQKPEVVVSPAFSRADVIYYVPSEYLPPLNTGGARKPVRQKGEPAYAPQPIISVPPEADNRSQTIVTPSDLKLNHDVPLPNIVAWSRTHAPPAVPLASTTAATADPRLPALPVAVIAPAPETISSEQPRTPSLSQAVVAPAPEVNAQSSARAVQAPQAAIVAPTPRLDEFSLRRLGDINIGHSAVVAPAPELPVAEQYADRYATTGRAQSAMGPTGPAVVPPPPSIAGNAGADPGGRLISLGIQPAVAAPQAMPAGNRRGTFAATPSGKAGAAGTPEVSADNNSGSGSGSAASKELGIPTGLSVGGAPKTQTNSTMAGQGSGNGIGSGTSPSHNSDSSRLVANVTPPRVPSAATPAASDISQDQATDVDHSIFGDRKFYAMTLNMPNLNSAGGSWVIRFAELNGNQTKGNESKGELTAPVATQKVDPAYPLELMRRNVHGTVTLYAVIRNDGSVTDVRVLRGVDDRLDEYARAALAHWRFRPAIKNGNPVDLEAVVLIPFRPVRGKSGF